MRRARFSWDPYLILLVGLSLLVLAPLSAPGYFYDTHDGRHSVFFITMFDEAIRSGALWPRWGMHHNMGYGYPTFLVQAPLAMYVAELFVLAGVGVTHAAKLTWVIAILTGAWGMYVLVKRWCGGGDLTRAANRHKISMPALCGVAAGLLYTYAPYHLLDMYVRAALAETLLMAWFPWVILAFDGLIVQGTGPGWQGRLFAAAASYAGALLTHAFALPAFTPLLAGFILFRLWLAWWSKAAQPLFLPTGGLTRRTLLSLFAGLAGLLLAAVFLWPLVIDGQFLVQENWTRGTYSYERHWVHIGQFFSPFWGYGYSDDPTGANDGMGFQQGAILLLLAFCAVYLLLQAARGADKTEVGEMPSSSWQQTQQQFLVLFFVVATVAVLFATTSLATGVWRSVQLLEIIQFPWRLLAPAAFTLSVVGGLVIWQVGEGVGWWRVDAEARAEAGILALLLVILLAGFAYSRPGELLPIAAWREDGRAVTEFEAEHPDMYGYTQYNELPYAPSPMQAQYLAALEEGQPFVRNELTRFVITAGEGGVFESYSLGHAFGGKVEMATAGTVQIQLLAFPGWQVKVNGLEVAPRLVAPYGLMEVDVPVGSHDIELWMGVTPAARAGFVTSGLTLLLLIGLWQAGRLRSRQA